jgi:hypothetical protein
MTLYDFKPYFNYVEEVNNFEGAPDSILLEGKKVLMSEIFALDDDAKCKIVLNDFNVHMLNISDYFCFVKAIHDIEDNERNIHIVMKMLLNGYESRGGYPLDWIHYVLNIFTSNHYSFSELSQTYIETFLTQTLVNYERNPYRKNRLTNPYFDDDNERSYELLKTFFLKQYDLDSLLLGLKEAFSNEKGKDIRIIIEILKDYSILVIPDKKFKMLYDCLKEFFERNIGSYASINDYKNIHRDDYKIIKVKVDDLLKRISK